MRRFAPLAAVLAALAVPTLASAQGPATVRGVVYSCADHRPMPSARVTLRGLDDGSVMHVTADAHGRFARVGLDPGRYLVIAQYVDARSGRTSDSASRLAWLNADDVLDMSIGTDALLTISVLRPRGWVPPDPNQPHPRCDPAVVPPALPTSDRYIIH